VTGEPFLNSIGRGQLAISLANTLVSDRPGRDLLTRVVDLKGWLARHQFHSLAASETELERFRELRAAVRELFAACTADTRLPAQALATINAFAARAPRAPRLRWRNGRLSAHLDSDASLSDQALAAIAGDAIALAASGQRLRACEGHSCRLYFVAEHPKRRWCDSRVCGNRARVARHAARHRGQDVDQSARKLAKPLSMS
jgi:predicted RNA-binding Zn ribbon-like protein